MTTYRFDPVDLEQMRLLGRLSPGGRIRLMLDARELAVGLIRGRLRRQYPDLSPRDLNLKVLEEIETYYPGAKGYEVAGFFWWQGDKDRYNPGHAAMYERNLVLLLEALRKEFDAPDAPLVIATLGQTDRDAAKGTEKDIIEGMFAISDPGKYPQYKGEVATVYSHPLSKGGASNGHYGGNAETYMNVGLGMGEAMVELLEAAK